MRRITAVLMLGWVMTAYPQTNLAPANLNPDEAINRLRQGLVDSFTKGDIEGLLSHLDTNVVVTWQNAEVSRGREGVREYYVRMMKGDKPVVKEIRANPEVLARQVYGDWAISHGKLNDLFILTDGSELPMNSVFTATIARRGDRWLVTAYHASVDAFDNPVLKVAVKKTALITGAGLGILGLLLGYFLGRRNSHQRNAAPA